MTRATARRAALLAAALASGACGAEAKPQQPPPPAAAASMAAARPAPAPRLRPARPASVAIPAISVSARVVALEIDREGRLEAPQDPSEVGWWSGGPRPGETGPAVLAGHVDDLTGPAVFAKLAELPRGSRIVVTDRRGRRHAYSVQRVVSHPKSAFPTQDVYGESEEPVLRLITCGGFFDRRRGHYDDNVIVYARSTRASTARTPAQ